MFEQLITLTPKSARGKQIIKECGDQWRVLDKKESVLFSQDSGPWLRIEPANDMPRQERDRATRWVHQSRDNCFNPVQETV